MQKTEYQAGKNWGLYQMIFIFDTSSFVSMARYYLPFDSQGIMYQHVKSSIINGRILVIDAVLDECRYVAGRIVVNELDFLSDNDFMKSCKAPINSKNITPTASKKFYRMVENNFTTPIKNNLSDVQFESQKQDFLKSADCRIIIYTYNFKHKNPESEFYIVTEETRQPNDPKVFKKIPAICDQLKIKSITLPKYLKKCRDLGLNIG